MVCWARTKSNHYSAHDKKISINARIERKEKLEVTVVYGSLESVVVPISGMKGGWPAVDQNVCFVGKVIP